MTEMRVKLNVQNNLRRGIRGLNAVKCDQHQYIIILVYICFTSIYKRHCNTVVSLDRMVKYFTSQRLELLLLR